MNTKRKITEVVFPRELLDGLFQFAKSNHPREVFLLLRGKARGGTVYVEEFILPVGTTFGLGFSGFPPYALPTDPSIIGTIHSHPSGISKPSVQDMNSFFGIVMVIVAYPYDISSTSAFDSNGIQIYVKVTD